MTPLRHPAGPYLTSRGYVSPEDLQPDEARVVADAVLPNDFLRMPVPTRKAVIAALGMDTRRAAQWLFARLRGR